MISAVAALAAAKRRTTSVGVCWTLNEAPPLPKEQSCRHGHVPDALAPWAALRASAITLKTFHPTVKTCLFTDAPETAVRDHMAALQRCGFPKDQGAMDLFDEIIAQEPFEALHALTNFEKQVRGHPVIRVDDVWVKFRSRLMRMRNLARVPFDVTLAVDDDTVFCPTDDLEINLRALATRDVRFVPEALAKGKSYSNALQEAGRLRDCGECWDAGECPGLAADKSTLLQGGAALLRRGPGLNAFVDAWFDSYVAYYEKELHKNSTWRHDSQLGADQPPLRDVARDRCLRPSNATWTIGALPANYNVRFLHPPETEPLDLVLKRGSANVSDSLYGALDGPAVVLHSHFYWQCASPASCARVDSRRTTDSPVASHAGMRKSTRGLISQTRQACGALNHDRGLRIFANGRVEVL